MGKQKFWFIVLGIALLVGAATRLATYIKQFKQFDVRDIKEFYRDEIGNAVINMRRNHWWLLDEFDAKFKDKVNQGSLEI